MNGFNSNYNTRSNTRLISTKRFYSKTKYTLILT